MKIQVQWDNEKQTIIRYIFETGWGWNDLHEAMNEAGNTIRSVPHRVDVIMDISRASLVPKGALSQINRAYSNAKPENIGLTVIVAPNAFLSAMVSMAKKIWGEKTDWQLEFVHSNDDAYKTIQSAAANSEESSRNGH